MQFQKNRKGGDGDQHEEKKVEIVIVSTAPQTTTKTTEMLNKNHEWMKLPISHWIWGGSSQENQKGGGGSGNKPGQVPMTPDGKYTEKDLAQLNNYIREAENIAAEKGLSPMYRQKKPVTQDDMLKPIAIFSLGEGFTNHPTRAGGRGGNDETKAIAYPVGDLLVPPGLPPIVAENSRYANATRSGIDKSLSKCRNLDQKQNMRRIKLDFSNILPLYSGRWADSVGLDSFLHILKQHWKYGDLLYINSAQHDPSIEEILNTPDCFLFGLIPLFRHDHWTIVFIDHVSKIIRYLNSQVVDESTPRIQIEPFKRAFPGYSHSLFTKSQQRDNNSCGIYLLIFAFLFLFYTDRDMDQVTQTLVDRFRKIVVLQILLHFLVLRRN